MMSLLSGFFRSVPIVVNSLLLVSLASIIAIDALVALPSDITISSDTQEEDPQTGDVIAKGNVIFEFPAAQVRGYAEEARFIKEKKVIILLKNARLIQQGEELQGDGFACAIEKKICMPAEQLPSQARESLGL